VRGRNSGVTLKLLSKIRELIHLSYSQKVFLVATLPLVLAVAAISILVQSQTRQLSEQELLALERELLSAKEAELQNYLSIARSAFFEVYGPAGPDDEEAKLRVTQILSAMTYGKDGFFFVYDYDGNNLVSPRQTYLIGQNWSGTVDARGTNVVDSLIEIAKNGGGYHSYFWPKPSTGETAEMVTYVVGLQDWRWAVGTGIFIDDVGAELDATRAQTELRIQKTSLQIVAIAFASLFVVFLSGMLINLRERRMSDIKLRQLTQRIFDTQEEERSRVARELHDGISQILVGVRYALELALRNLSPSDGSAKASIDKGRDGLAVAINEIRRISRDLRPGVLDDLGLGPALKTLTAEFGARTGIEVEFETVVFSNRLNEDSKTALYRVAQEALTNIERHAQATRISLKVFGHRNGATLRIEDNGVGIPEPSRDTEAMAGLGLRNMQERVEHLHGTLSIVSTGSGTIVEATIPLTSIKNPRDDKRIQPA
jgi:two-component system NarL family sensor kinase